MSQAVTAVLREANVQTRAVTARLRITSGAAPLKTVTASLSGASASRSAASSNRRP